MNTQNKKRAASGEKERKSQGKRKTPSKVCHVKDVLRWSLRILAVATPLSHTRKWVSLFILAETIHLAISCNFVKDVGCGNVSKLLVAGEQRRPKKSCITFRLLLSQAASHQEEVFGLLAFFHFVSPHRSIAMHHHSFSQSVSQVFTTS